MPPKAKPITSKRQNASARQSRPQGRTVRTVASSGLDGGGQAYARLLSDPCNAPLCHPTYNGSEGAYLLRAESILSPTLTTETAGFLHWTPGAASAAAGGAHMCTGFSASGSTGVGITTTFGTSSPGIAFLGTNASAIRCVAACLKVSYAGSESSRSGRVHFGQTSGGLINSNGPPITPDEIAPLLPHFCRTPAQEFELVWKPNDSDQMFVNPDSAVTAPTTLKDSKASLTVSWAGLPAGVGLTFRFTAIYEWQPDLNRGLSVPNLSKSPSSNSLDEVVNYLVRAGFPFVRGMAMNIGSALVSGVANYFGTMPSGIMSNTRRNRLM